jgi:Zn finger protein HypA/HybF involved in hydrogenase expression
MNTSWLNNMNTLECLACKHEWTQPADKGKCPKCYSNRTQLVLSRVNVLPRV